MTDGYYIDIEKLKTLISIYPWYPPKSKSSEKSRVDWIVYKSAYK